IAGIKKMPSTAYQGGGSVLIEFQAGTDLGKALEDVRAKVADARPDLPDGLTSEPTVSEVTLAQFPVLVVTLSGDLPERVLTRVARELRDRIEDAPGVLEAKLQGVRDDLIAVTIDPAKIAAYGLRPDQL
ncbi:efflux RND transporter permease subunit, partial [Thioclava sp. BHET1]